MLLMLFAPRHDKRICTLIFNDGKVIEETNCEMHAGFTGCKGVDYTGVKELRCR